MFSPLWIDPESVSSEFESSTGMLKRQGVHLKDDLAGWVRWPLLAGVAVMQITGDKRLDGCSEGQS